jgi:hypothetical protein
MTRGAPDWCDWAHVVALFRAAQNATPNRVASPKRSGGDADDDGLPVAHRDIHSSLDARRGDLALLLSRSIP